MCAKKRRKKKGGKAKPQSKAVNQAAESKSAAAEEEAAEASSEEQLGTEAKGEGLGKSEETPQKESDENAASEEDKADKEMHLVDHLEELRDRLVRVVASVFVGFLACYGFAEELFNILLAPLTPLLPEGSTLIFTSLPEGFFTYVKLSAVAGIFVASPYIFYQIWQFTAPALYEHERKFLIPIALISSLFFSAGAVFGYMVVFPFAFEFFMGFGTDIIKPLPSLREYLSFTLKLLIAFGVAFELPLFIFFLARLGVVTAKTLRKFRKYAILLSFMASALLTPPDVVSQTLMAGPLVILYELGILAAVLFGKRKPEPEPEDDAEEEKA
jgi:sec-independent protein translocase protein TatC